MNKIIGFCLVVLIETNSFGQKPTGKTLFEIERAKIEEIALIMPDSGLILAENFLVKSLKTKNEQNYANALSTNALVKIWQAQSDEALKINDKSFAINKKLNNSAEMAINYYQYGKIFQNISDYVNATKYFLLSNDVAEKVKDYSLIQKNFRSIAYVYLNQNNIPKFYEYIEKAIFISKKWPKSIDMADNHLLLGIYFAIIEKEDSSVHYYNSAEIIFRNSKNYFRLANLFAQKSLLYEETNPIKSVEIELESQEILDKYAPEHILSISNLGNIGESYFEFAKNDSLLQAIINPNIPKTKLGLVKASKSYLNRALLIANKKKSVKNVAFYSGILSDVHAFEGNFLEAYQKLQEKTHLNDSLFSQKNKNAIAKLESEKEVIQLNAINKQKTTNNKVLIGLFLGLSVLSLLGYRNFRNRQKIQQLKITELEKDKQLLAVDAMLKGQEEERNRIAKDLHDGLGGMLAGVKMSFTNMKENLIMTAENVSVFEKSIGQLDTTITELRKIAQNLMPEALVKFGLYDAVEDFCLALQKNSNIPINFQKIGEDRILDNTANTNIYRIIQELVNNAIKHGQASQILVQISTLPNKIMITVEDNGIGIDPNNNSKGMGISNIKHRVNYYKGSVDFENNFPTGTVVNIDLNV